MNELAVAVDGFIERTLLDDDPRFWPCFFELSHINASRAAATLAEGARSAASRRSQGALPSRSQSLQTQLRPQDADRAAFR